MSGQKLSKAARENLARMERDLEKTELIKRVTKTIEDFFDNHRIQ